MTVLVIRDNCSAESSTGLCAFPLVILGRFLSSVSATSVVCLFFERPMPETQTKIFVNLRIIIALEIRVNFSQGLFMYLSLNALNVSLDHKHVYATQYIKPLNIAKKVLSMEKAPYTLVIKMTTIDLADPLFIIVPE